MRLLRAVPLLLVVLTPSARASGFERVSTGAEKLDSLEAFLVKFVGKCTDPFEKAACERNVAAARRSVSGKTFAVRVPDAALLVRPKLQDDRFTLLVTPFVDGGGLALTNGTPARQDAAGNPVVNLIPIHGTLPPGTMEMEFESPFRTGAIELEIVFRAEKAWKLQRKGERNYEGVAARFLAIRIVDARTGSEIASKVL